MAHYILFVLILNMQTGEFQRVETTGREYDSQQECLKAAIEQGPQKAIEGTVRVFSCGHDRQEISI
jgi:hypothetical protein